MKFLSALLVFFFCITASFAQKKEIKITNSLTKKERHFKENLRIRVVTNEGKRITGRFRVIDNETIHIKKHTIHLADIKKIKRHPVAMSIFTHSGAIAFASGFFIGTAVASSFNNNEGILYANIPVAAGVSYHLIKGPNILKGFKKSENWEYEILIKE